MTTNDMHLTREEKLSILKPKLEAIEKSGENTNDQEWKNMSVLASALLMLLEEK